MIRTNFSVSRRLFYTHCLSGLVIFEFQAVFFFYCSGVAEASRSAAPDVLCLTCCSFRLHFPYVALITLTISAVVDFYRTREGERVETLANWEHFDPLFKLRTRRPLFILKTGAAATRRIPLCLLVLVTLLRSLLFLVKFALAREHAKYMRVRFSSS